MCEHCLQYPHHPRCPNAPEPPVYAKCDSCGGDIYDGDDFYMIDGNNYCETCVKDGLKTAEVDE